MFYFFHIIKDIKLSKEIYLLFILLSLFISIFIFKKIKNKINNDKYIFYKKNDFEYNYNNSLNYIKSKDKSKDNFETKNIIEFKDNLSEYEKYNLYMNNRKGVIDEKSTESELDDNSSLKNIELHNLSSLNTNVYYILNNNDYYSDNYDKYNSYLKKEYTFNKYVDEDDETIPYGLRYKIDEHGNVLYFNNYVGAPIIPRKYGYTSKIFCKKFNFIDKKVLLDTVYKIKSILLNYYNNSNVDNISDDLPPLKIKINDDTNTIIDIINKYKEGDLQEQRSYNYHLNYKTNNSNFNYEMDIKDNFININKNDCYQLLIIIDIILYCYTNKPIKPFNNREKFKTKLELLNYKLNIYANKIIFENPSHTYTQNRHFLLLIQLLYNELRLFFSY